MKAGLVFGLWMLAAACGKPGGAGGPVDGTPVDVPGHIPGSPGLGAHSLVFYRLAAASPPVIGTAALATQPAGSTLVVSVGRGSANAAALPTDNKGNSPYQQLGDVHRYTMYPGAGTALYAFPSAAGGAGHVISASTPPSDEITLAAVEVIEGTRIQAFEHIEVTHPNTLTSRSVTTTGPATLIAFWWGDAAEPGDKTAVPDNGFAVIDSVLEEGALVQCAVAVKNVAAAGTHDVTWTATPVQGAQLWLVAVQ